jgi:spore coat polysaccharide biosynthesis predicted glycosyltransferase SpsG
VVALRADGGAAVGLGHTRRCLALATAIALWGDCHLLLRGERAAAAGAGVPVVMVGPSWDETLRAARGLGASALVVDSYAVGASDLRTARAAGLVVVAIDDSGRFPIPADLVVNPALGPTAPEMPDGTAYLLGPRFALLAPDFADAAPRPARAEVRRVLVALGGATRAALIGTVAHAVHGALPGAALDVVVGPVGDGVDAVRAAVEGLDRVTLRPSPPTLRPLMDAADLAVTAGGVTMLELAAVGVPVVGVSLTPNQDANLDGFAAAGAVTGAGRLGDAGLGDRIGAAVRDFGDPARRRAAAERARALVDGAGAGRVAAGLRERLEAPVRAGR